MERNPGANPEKRKRTRRTEMGEEGVIEVERLRMRGL
jgi:hypothetical protein